MPWWAWLCLGIFLAALVATAIFSAFAFGRLRRLSATADAIRVSVDEVARAAEELERRVARTEQRMAELELHRAQLEASLERLRVLTAALGDATGGVRRLRRQYLRK
jgi:phage shock protein A